MTIPSTPVVHTTPEVLAKAEVDERMTEASQWLALVSTFTIQTDEQQEQVASMLKDVKGRLKHLDAQRTTITGPLYQAWRATNELFAPPKAKLEELERVLKKMVSEYLRAKEQKNQVALQAAATAPTAYAASVALTAVAPVAPPQGVSVRKVLKMQVTQPELVPRELCSPDPQKIWKAVEGVAGVPEVPGVRFFYEDQVTARSK